MIASGLAEKNDTRRLFVRAEWIELWKKLDGNTNIILSGPPGTGKSSLVWWWCCWHAQRRDLRWTHLGRTGAVEMADFTSRNITTYNPLINPDYISEISTTAVPTLVIDGLTRESNMMAAAFSWWKDDSTHRRVIYVTSIQSPLNIEDLQHSDLTKGMSSRWEPEEYELACKDQTFLGLVEAMQTD